MPLELHPMLEADLPAFHEIAHVSGQSGVGRLIWPNNTFTTETRDWMAAADANQMRNHPEMTKYWKVIDTSLPDSHAQGKMIAGAKWRIYAHARTDEDREREAQEGKQRGLPPGANAEFCKAFFAELGKCDREVLGNMPVVTLSLLFTHPDHHRRGAGRMLVQWGLDVADEIGVPAFVEASPMGRPLYESMGYEFVRKVNVDVQEWGHPEPLPYVCLLRPAKKEKKAT